MSALPPCPECSSPITLSTSYGRRTLVCTSCDWSEWLDQSGLLLKKFEYIEVEPPRFRESADMVTFLNSYGAVGWELVHLQDVMAVFKREITPEEK